MNTPPSTSAISSGRGFACLWAARDLSALGNWAVFVALLAWSYKNKESAAVLSILLLAQMLPPFLLGPLAGLTVNRRTGQAIAVLAPLLRAAALVPLLSARTYDDMRLVLVAVALAAVPAAFAQASHRALLPGLVDPGRLPSIERALSATRFATLIVGPAAGYLLYGMEGLQSATAAAIAALVLSAALLLFARPRRHAEASAEAEPAPRPDLPALREGLIHTWRHPSLQVVATVRLAVALVTGGLVVVEVAYLIWGVFAPTENIGLVLAAQGLGMAIGSAAHGFARRRFPPSTLVATALILVASAEFGFAISGAINGVVAFSAVIGFGSGVLIRTLAPLASALSSEGLAQSASVAVETAAEAAALLSLVALGPLVDAISPRFTLVIASILLTVLALYAFGAVTDPEGLDRKASDPGREPSYPSIRPA